MGTGMTTLPVGKTQSVHDIAQEDGGPGARRTALIDEGGEPEDGSVS